jgi:hypothetical protein
MKTNEIENYVYVLEIGAGVSVFVTQYLQPERKYSKVEEQRV